MGKAVFWEIRSFGEIQEKQWQKYVVSLALWKVIRATFAVGYLDLS